MSTPLHSQNELMESRAKLIEQARELVNRAKEDKRDLHADEVEQYDRILADAASFKTQADRDFKLTELEKEIETVTRAAPKTQTQPNDLLYTLKNTQPDVLGTTEYRDAFSKFLRTNNPMELRALEGGVGSEGGDLIPTFLSENIFGIASQGSAMFDLASQKQTDSGRFEIVRVVTSGTADAGANEEADLSALSTDVAFGQRSLDVNNRKASFYIVASDELIEDSKFDLEAEIALQGGTGIAEQDEQQYVSGAGTNGPTGFLNDADIALTTSAAFAYADLATLKYSVRDGWRSRGTWLMNDATLSAVTTLEDTGNTLIFIPSAIAGAPDRLLGSPIRTSFAMAGDGVGNKPIAFGDFSQYVILTKPLTLKRSDHVLFATGQVAFRLTHRRDGRLAKDGAVQVLHRTS